jgi:sulfoxide reductase heme-binding subunit YedZ
MFGLANYTGLIATLILVLLLATSNDWALRKLGTPQWKQLQRWNYACFGLTAIHTFAYQEGVESQTWLFLGLGIAAVATTAMVQLAGYYRRRGV